MSSRSRLALASIAALALAASGCSQKARSVLGVPNQPPRVELSAHLSVSSPTSTTYDLSWRASDPDGRVDHYLYAVDPPDDADTTWIVTTDNEKRLAFSAPKQSPTKDSLTVLRGFHVFVIAAVDNDGA